MQFDRTYPPRQAPRLHIDPAYKAPEPQSYFKALDPEGQQVNITCKKKDLQSWLDRGYTLIDKKEKPADAADGTEQSG